MNIEILKKYIMEEMENTISEQQAGAAAEDKFEPLYQKLLTFDSIQDFKNDVIDPLRAANKTAERAELQSFGNIIGKAVGDNKFGEEKNEIYNEIMKMINGEPTSLNDGRLEQLKNPPQEKKEGLSQEEAKKVAETAIEQTNQTVNKIEADKGVELTDDQISQIAGKIVININNNIGNLMTPEQQTQVAQAAAKKVAAAQQTQPPASAGGTDPNIVDPDPDNKQRLVNTFAQFRDDFYNKAKTKTFRQQAVLTNNLLKALKAVYDEEAKEAAAGRVKMQEQEAEVKPMNLKNFKVAVQSFQRAVKSSMELVKSATARTDAGQILGSTDREAVVKFATKTQETIKILNDYLNSVIVPTERTGPMTESTAGDKALAMLEDIETIFDEIIGTDESKGGIAGIIAQIASDSPPELSQIKDTLKVAFDKLSKMGKYFPSLVPYEGGSVENEAIIGQYEKAIQDMDLDASDVRALDDAAVGNVKKVVLINFQRKLIKFSKEIEKIFGVKGLVYDEDSAEAEAEDSGTNIRDVLAADDVDETEDTDEPSERSEPKDITSLRALNRFVELSLFRDPAFKAAFVKLDEDDQLKTNLKKLIAYVQLFKSGQEPEEATVSEEQISRYGGTALINVGLDQSDLPKFKSKINPIDEPWVEWLNSWASGQEKDKRTHILNLMKAIKKYMDMNPINLTGVSNRQIEKLKSGPTYLEVIVDYLKKNEFFKSLSPENKKIVVKALIDNDTELSNLKVDMLREAIDKRARLDIQSSLAAALPATEVNREELGKFLKSLEGLSDQYQRGQIETLDDYKEKEEPMAPTLTSDPNQDRSETDEEEGETEDTTEPPEEVDPNRIESVEGLKKYLKMIRAGYADMTGFAAKRIVAWLRENKDKITHRTDDDIAQATNVERDGSEITIYFKRPTGGEMSYSYNLDDPRLFKSFVKDIQFEGESLLPSLFQRTKKSFKKIFKIEESNELQERIAEKLKPLIRDLMREENG